MRRTLATIALVGALLAACGPPGGTGTRSPTASASASEGGADGGPSAPAKPVDPASVPPVDARELAVGARFVGVARKGAATAEIRVVVRAGSADDGERPGTARTVGRAMVTAYETLAASDGRAANDLAVRVTPNATIYAFRCAPDGVAPTLKALAVAFSKVALDAAETRAAAGIVALEAKAERADLTEVGPRFVQRDLFVAPIGRHPYAITLLTAEDLGRVEPKSASAYLSTFYVASNLTLVAVSATPTADVAAAAEEALASVRKGEGRASDVDGPESRARPMKVMLVDSPKQDPVLFTLGKFGPTVAQGTDTKTRIFGAIVGDRLARVNVSKSRFEVVPFRQAPVLAMVRAEIPAGAAADGIKKIHEVLAGWTGAPTADELVAGKNAVTGEILRTIDPPSAFADALARGASVDLPTSALEARGLELTLAEADDVGVTGQAILGHDGILVVVGDAKTLAPALTVFGEVDVLDPNADFARVRSVSP